MNQQPNLFTEELWESPELMQAIIESYLEANPLIKTCVQGFIQSINSVSSNSCQQNQECKKTNNDPKDSNSEINKDDDCNKNNETNACNNDNDCIDNNENHETPHYSDILSQIINGIINHQFPFFSSLLQMFQGQQERQNNQSDCSAQEKNPEQATQKETDDSIIQDIIMQTLSPDIYDSASNQPSNSNDNDNNENAPKEENEVNNDESHQNQVLDVLEMIKVLYQMYLLNKSNPSEFYSPLCTALSNVADQFFPQLHFLFDTQKFKSNSKSKNDNSNTFDQSNATPFRIFNPLFQMMNQRFTQQENKKVNKNFKAELKRTKFVDSNGIVTWRIRRSLGDKWHEIENEMNDDGKTIKSTKETWNNISEDKFDNFNKEWEQIYSEQTNAEEK